LLLGDCLDHRNRIVVVVVVVVVVDDVGARENGGVATKTPRAVFRESHSGLTALKFPPWYP
jgi:hypothetical protein